MLFKDCEIYKNKSGIYMIKNLVNNKVYVGQTNMRFIRRFWHHQWMLSHNRHDNIHLQCAWNKYGANNFEFSVLQECNKPDDLNELEIYYINYYNSISNGYNMQSGGKELLHTFIPESSRKIVGMKNRERLLGCHLSEETKHKMSQSRIGSKNGFAKLTEEDVRQIKIMIRDGYRPKDIYTKYNITYGNFKMIRSGKTWKHVTI